MHVVAVCVQGCLGKHCPSQRRTGNNLKTQQVGNGWVPCGSAVLSESHAALDKQVGMRPPAREQVITGGAVYLRVCVCVRVCTHRESECGKESEGERKREKGEKEGDRKRGRK